MSPRLVCPVSPSRTNGTELDQLPAGPWARFDPVGASGRGRPRNAGSALHRRGAQSEHHDAQGVHRRRLHRAPGVRLRCRGPAVRHRTHREVQGGAREHRAEARSIARLLAPQSIAVIGASHDPAKLGHIVLLNLLRGDLAGPVYSVTPDAVSVQGPDPRRDHRPGRPDRLEGREAARAAAGVPGTGPPRGVRLRSPGTRQRSAAPQLRSHRRHRAVPTGGV